MLGRLCSLIALTLALPLSAQQPEPRTVDRHFTELTLASFGAAALDVATTRRCIDAGTCQEANPLMKCSAGCQYARVFGEVGALTLVSYEMKKHGVRKWWLAPTFEISMHGGLAGLNMRF